MRRPDCEYESAGQVTVATAELIIIEGTFPAQVLLDLRPGADVVVLERDELDRLTEIESERLTADEDAADRVDSIDRKLREERKQHKATKALLSGALQECERLRDRLDGGQR